jgi:hypothetical protein
LQEYLLGKGHWVPMHKPEFENEDDKFIPDKPINNYKLGDIVRYFIEQLYAEEILQSKQ